MKISYYGQSAFQIETKNKVPQVDPFISPNELAADINVAKLKADYILLTHGHEDHVVDTETIAKNKNVQLISNYEIVSYYGEKGISGHPMNTGGKWNFDFGTVKCVSAVHSSVMPDGTYAGSPMGFVISNEDASIYLAGDTALTMDMKLIPMTCPKLNVAILPIGDNFTMGPEDAALAADFVDCDKIIACHFDTFGFIKVDHAYAKQCFEARGKELIFLNIGESIEI